MHSPLPGSRNSRQRPKRAGEAFGFPGEAALPLSLGFRAGGVDTVVRSRVDGVHGHNLAAAGCQGGGSVRGERPIAANPDRS